MKTILLRAFPASLLFIFFAAFTNAQSSRPDAQLPDTQVKGTLLDASGAGVGGVHVEAQREGDPGQLWKATTSTAGEYTLTLRAACIFRPERISASISSTRMSRSAAALASAQAVVVLPSSGRAEVIRPEATQASN